MKTQTFNQSNNCSIFQVTKADIQHSGGKLEPDHLGLWAFPYSYLAGVIKRSVYIVCDSQQEAYQQASYLDQPLPLVQ